MKKIMYAGLHVTRTKNEYAWTESNEAEYGHEWDGNVAGYIKNLDIDFDEKMIIPEDECTATIHDVPANAIVIVDLNTGYPSEMYWPVDQD